MILDYVLWIQEKINCCNKKKTKQHCPAVLVLITPKYRPLISICLIRSHFGKKMSGELGYVNIKQYWLYKMCSTDSKGTLHQINCTVNANEKCLDDKTAS